ncbi:MAG: glycoside hydrolase family 99-like domain-containing protein [Puniceicoccales bacterium]|nr:glycoside hydrolase family 99-like domain-containing protein [Puniceicoccales bacterium]
MSQADPQNGTTNSPAKNSQYDVAAYVWPSCHDEPSSRKAIWDKGIGEWEIIQKATPRFEGHYQPKVPLWGYEMDDDPKVVEKWIDAATKHGVNVFIYDWYWYDGGPFLESALNNGFLKAANNKKMQFYIMWANHDVQKKFWNTYRYRDDASILWNGAADWENFKIITKRVISQYFKQPNYYKIDGKPVFAIFSIEKLLEGFGGSVEKARKALDYLREETKKAGFPDVHIQATFGWGSSLSDRGAKSLNRQLNSLGFNSATLYNMGGFNQDYLTYIKNALKIQKQWGAALDVPFFPCASTGWDDTPRFPEKGKNGKGLVHINHSPENFGMLLQKTKEYIDSHPKQPKLLVINAWNEWVEGNYLLPDVKYGFTYLETVKKVFPPKKK